MKEFQFYLPKTELPSYILDKRIDQVYEWMVSGVSRIDVIDLIMEEFGVPSKIEAIELIDRVLQDGVFKEQQDKEYVFESHMHRYEDMYSKEMDMMWNGFPLDVDDYNHRKIIADKINAALEMLKGKEELLGIHNSKFIIEVQNNFNLSSSNSVPTSHINLDNLSDEEKVEFLGMIRKMRINAEDGVQPLKIAENTETEDYEEAVIVEEEDKIEQVTDKFKEEKEEVETDEITELRKQASKIRDIEKNIQESHVSKFKKLLNKKNES